MSITQVISTITDPPDTNDPANFDARADQLFNVELPQLVTELNVYRTQVNSTASDVNADALSAAQQVALATQQAQIATEAKEIAVGAANYKGEYSAVITYLQGQSVSFMDSRYVAKKTNLGITPVNGNDWLEITPPFPFRNLEVLAEIQAVALSF